MKDGIIVIIGIDGDHVVARACYSGRRYFVVDNVCGFNPHEYSKHFFSHIGEKLGEELFFESKRAEISESENIQIYNGYNFAIGSAQVIESLFDRFCGDPLSQVTGISRGSPVNGDEMEAFCSAFRRGLKVGFPSLGWENSLIKFTKFSLLQYNPF